jgi:hypothetical protein
MTYPDQAAAEWAELRAYTVGEVHRRRDAAAAGEALPAGLFSHLVCDPVDEPVVAWPIVV